MRGIALAAALGLPTVAASCALPPPTTPRADLVPMVPLSFEVHRLVVTECEGTSPIISPSHELADLTARGMHANLVVSFTRTTQTDSASTNGVVTRDVSTTMMRGLVARCPKDVVLRAVAISQAAEKAHAESSNAK